MSKGFKSTEFWIAIAAAAGGLYASMNGAPAAAIIAAMTPLMTYIGGRSHVKAKGKA